MKSFEQTISPIKKKILITGAAGFIGYHLAYRMLQSGIQVVGIDNMNNYYSTDLKELRIQSLKKYSEFEYHQVDLTNFESIESIIKKYNFSTIFHLAAQAGVRIPVGQMYLYSASNLLAFSNILELAVKYRVSDFIFASSSSVYGNNASVPFLETEINLNPSSFYGATKLCNEILAKTLVVGSETRARGLRFFTVYGPGGRPDMAYFRLIASCVAGITFTLNGDGEIKRDFTYIEDVIDIVSLLEAELKKKAPGFFDVVNIGGGRPVSINELIALTRKLTGRIPKIKQKSAVLSDAKLTFAGVSYLESLIGHLPTTRLENGLPHTIEWAENLENIDLLKKWINSVK